MEPSPKKRRLASNVSSSSKVLPRDAEKSTLTTDEDWNKKELWILQLPKDLDPSLLDGQKIATTSKHRLQLSSDKGDNKTFETTVQATDNKRSSVVLIPTTKPGVLKHTSSTSLLCVQRAVDVPPVKIPSQLRSESRVEAPHGLKQRYKPFGWRKPVEVIEAPSPDTHHHHEKKRKQKRKKRHSSDSISQ